MPLPSSSSTPPVVELPPTPTTTTSNTMSSSTPTPTPPHSTTPSHSTAPSPSPSLSTSSSTARPLSHPPPSIMEVSTEPPQPPDNSLASIRLDPPHSNRHSNRWVRFLNFFHPSRRRRASYSLHFHNQQHHHHSRRGVHSSPLVDSSNILTPTSNTSNTSRLPIPRNLHAATSSASSSAAPPHSTSVQSSGIGIRRATRRERHLRLRQNPSRDREHSRRTMSDGALPHSPIQTPTSANTVTSTSQAPSVPPPPPIPSASSSTTSNSTSPSSMAPMSRSGRVPFPHSVASMRYRRMSARGGGDNGPASSHGIRSFGLSDNNSSNSNNNSNNSNSLDDDFNLEHTLRTISTGRSTENTTGAISMSSSPQSTDSRTSTLVSSALADLDAMPEQELFAVMNRIFDDYPGTPSDVYHSSVYVSRLPAHTRQRLAMRIPNAYLLPGRRQGRGYGNSGNGEGGGMRIGISGLGQHEEQHQNQHEHHMHHHHFHHGHGGSVTLHGAFGVEDREIRLNMHTLSTAMGQDNGRGNHNNNSRSGEPVATDEQIEALPSFVMEKGETRTVKEIFACMRKAIREEKTEEEEEEGDDEDDADDDGMMTSYTECAICLCDFEPGDEITSLPCGHYFHLNECVREWLSQHARTCPTCRADICE